MNTSRINPLSVDPTERLYMLCFADVSEVSAMDRQRTIQGNPAIVREDCEICATTDRTYTAGTYSPRPHVLTPRDGRALFSGPGSLRSGPLGFGAPLEGAAPGFSEI